MPKVSVILPVYNAEPYLETAVRSICAQTFTDFEFVIVNDGSTDGSEQILRRLAAEDARIHLISRPNTGYVKALLEAVAASSAPLIARMDADDIAHPQRFERQVAFMDAHPEVVVVGSAYNLIDARGRLLRPMPQPTDHQTLVKSCLQGTTPICHPASMFRRDAYDRAGGYDEATCPAEDLDLWLRMSEVGQLASIQELLLDYRLHADSVSETKQDRQMQAIRSICERAAARRNIAPSFKAEAWRAGSGAAGRQKQLLKYGWWAWNSGQRRTARAYGWEVVRQQPADLRGWKLLAAALLKRAPERR